jgi:CofD-related protein of GAK system
MPEAFRIAPFRVCGVISIDLKKTIRIPDRVKLARYRRSPDLGPKILFFSGGTALRKASQELVHYTHNSIHIVTPVDSGGSSAKLRDAFHMPAIGDVRNRLMALADRSLLGNPEIFDLFAFRFDKEEDQASLRKELGLMIDGTHPLVRQVHDPMRKIIRNHLDLFFRSMPGDFDLRGASIGNLILTGGYLGNHRHLDPVIYIFSKLVQVRGTVRPVTNEDLHLVARLEDGETIVGQHRLTGKEAPPIRSPISEVFVSRRSSPLKPATVPIREKMLNLLAEADLVCYPMGSFYSSLIANFLPEGVGRTLSTLPCPKVFVPSTGTDPECFGKTLMDQVTELLGYLKRDCPLPTRANALLNVILVDSRNGRYTGRLDKAVLDAWGIKVLDISLVSGESDPLIDEKRLMPCLLSFT